MHFQKRIIIDASLKRVFEVAEQYPVFVREYQEKKVVRSDAVHLDVKMGRRICGLWIRWEGEGIKYPYQRIEFTQISGLLKGLKAIWSFKEQKGETEVTIDAQFISTGVQKYMSALYGRFLVNNTLNLILKNLKREAQKK